MTAGLDASALPQQLLNGLMFGAIYALVALGYTMVYGVLKLINFAHGEVFMVGTYTALFVSWQMGYFQGAPGMTRASGPAVLLLMLVASMVVVGIMAVVALGILEPANISVLFEMKKEQPDVDVIEHLMKRFVYTAGVTGLMQVATLLIMTRVATQ